jgi:hypothetical protein
VSVQAQCFDRAEFDETRKDTYSTHMMKRMHTTIKRGRHAMPKKIQFEWELPDALVDALTPETTEVAETIKAAAVLHWVRTHKLSLRRGAELLHMSYHAFLDLMAAHRVPSIDYEAGWVDREQRLFEEDRGAASA